jgi:two-component system chemotaxis response regulator CheB
MAHRDIVVIGASAGGIDAIARILSAAPHDLRAAILIVVHISATGPGVLPMILNRAGQLPVKFAKDGEPIAPGRVYVAPPDYHLLVFRQRIQIAHGPKENGFRPAVDPLFRTAAYNFGARVVGVVLSGGMDDGTDGLAIIKENGGIAIAQDPTEAPFDGMPSSAIRNVAVDHIATVAQIPGFLVRYAAEVLSKEAAMPPNTEFKDAAAHGDHGLREHKMNGNPSPLTCPECGGTLWETQNGNRLRYQCHVGHAYNADSLLSERDRELEQALWSAVRTMEEAAALRRRMAGLARTAPWGQVAPPYAQQAAEMEQRAQILRRVLESASNGNGSPAQPRIARKKGGKEAAKKSPRNRRQKPA